MKMTVMVGLVLTTIATPVKAQTVTDVRFGFDQDGHRTHYIDVIDLNGSSSTEVAILGGDGWNELDLGGGKTVLSGQLTISLNGYIAMDNLGGQWVYPAISYSYVKGKTSTEGFIYHYIPLNGKSLAITGGNPVVSVNRQVGTRLSLGTSLDATRFEGDSTWSTKVGPQIRFGSPNRYVELRLAHDSATHTTEVRLRLFQFK